MDTSAPVLCDTRPHTLTVALVVLCTARLLFRIWAAGVCMPGPRGITEPGGARGMPCWWGGPPVIPMLPNWTFRACIWFW